MVRRHKNSSILYTGDIIKFSRNINDNKPKENKE